MDQNYDEMPDLIFFDPDDCAEEADFIRVDDLFREAGDAMRGPLLFTLFPRKAGRFLSARLSRLFRRTLLLTGMRIEKPAEMIRIRPMFVQWRIETGPEDDAAELVRAFRSDLEAQADLFLDLREDEPFWAVSCFVCPENDRITDDMICTLILSRQQPAAG